MQKEQRLERVERGCRQGSYIGSLIRVITITTNKQINTEYWWINKHGTVGFRDKEFVSTGIRRLNRKENTVSRSGSLTL